MKIVYAKDYLLLPDSDSCQIERFRLMLEAHPSDTCFLIEPGCYHFYQKNAWRRSLPVTNSDQAQEINIAVLLENMSNVVIDGQGAEFLFHGDLCPIAVSECRQVKLRNFSIDFDIPSSAEADILSVSEHAVDIRLDHRIFPYYIEGETLFFQRGEGETSPLFAAMEFDCVTEKVPEGTGDTFPKVRAREIKQDVIRLEGNYTVPPKAGNILVLRHGKRIHPGMLIQYCSDTALEQVAVHQTCGLGIVFQFCEDIRASGICFCANKERGRRILSGHDDGLHFSNNKGTIVIEDCSFQGLMDDAINVHGTAACLQRRTGSCSVRGVFCHPQSKGFPRWAVAGDLIGYINQKSRACEAVAVVKGYRLLSDEEFELTLDSELPKEVKPGYALENLTNTPAVVCRRNYFGSHRARGLLVTTPKPVRIEDNRFESSGCAILLAGDVNEWYESGTCTDVTIRGNTFFYCCSSKYQFCNAVIDIEPSIGKEQSAMVHSNVDIEDNHFYLVSDAILYADHTENVKLRKNHVVMRNGLLSPKYYVWKCKNVSCEDEVNRDEKE